MGKTYKLDAADFESSGDEIDTESPEVTTIDRGDFIEKSPKMGGQEAFELAAGRTMSAGLQPQIAGGMEVAGRAMGLTGLSGKGGGEPIQIPGTDIDIPFSNIRIATKEERAAQGWGDVYDETKQAFQQRQVKGKIERPSITMGGEFAGYAASIPILLNAIPAAISTLPEKINAYAISTTTPRLSKAITEGLALGGYAASGESENEPLSLDWFKEVLGGSTVTALLNLGLMGVGNVLGKVKGKATEYAKEKLGDTITEYGKKQVGKALGWSKAQYRKLRGGKEKRITETLFQQQAEGGKKPIVTAFATTDEMLSRAEGFRGKAGATIDNIVSEIKGKHPSGVTGTSLSEKLKGIYANADEFDELFKPYLKAYAPLKKTLDNIPVGDIPIDKLHRMKSMFYQFIKTIDKDKDRAIYAKAAQTWGMLQSEFTQAVDRITKKMGRKGLAKSLKAANSLYEASSAAEIALAAKQAGEKASTATLPGKMVIPSLVGGTTGMANPELGATLGVGLAAHQVFKSKYPQIKTAAARKILQYASKNKSQSSRMLSDAFQKGMGAFSSALYVASQQDPDIRKEVEKNLEWNKKK
jgi:hypothetical protein